MNKPPQEYWLGSPVPEQSLLRSYAVVFSSGSSILPQSDGIMLEEHIRREIRRSKLYEAFEKLSVEKLTDVINDGNEHPGARILAMRALRNRERALLPSEAFAAIQHFIDDDSVLIRIMAIRSLELWPDKTVGKLEELVTTRTNWYMKSVAIDVLSNIENKECLRILLDCVNNSSGDIERRACALAAVRWCRTFDAPTEDEKRALEFSLQAASDTETPRKVREELVYALQSLSDWESKLAIGLELLCSTDARRHEIDARALLNSIVQPNQLHAIAIELTKRVVRYAVDKNRIVTGKLAAFLIETYQGDADLADLQVQRVAKEENLETKHLQKLRLQIGGMPEVIEGAAQFKKSIEDLTERTLESWKTTTSRIAYAFWQRLFMSAVVFGVGAWLVGSYAYQVSMGQSISGFEIVVPVAALAAMALIFYSAPVSDVRQSVTDLAVANVTFVGYVDTILKVSHVFVYDYLSREIDYEKLKNMSGLVSDATEKAVKALRSPATDVGATHIKEAMDAWLPVLERLQTKPPPEEDGKKDS